MAKAKQRAASYEGTGIQEQRGSLGQADFLLRPLNSQLITPTAKEPQRQVVPLKARVRGGR